VSRRTAIIVPAYNEASRIGEVLAALVMMNHMVVVVDDGSTDGMHDVALNYPVHLVRHPFNLGQGAALQTGLTYALSRGADILVTFDADGQHDVKDLPALIEPIATGTADVVFGSRFLGTANHMPRSRRLLVQSATWLYTLVTRAGLSDANCGLRAFSRRAASRIHITQNRMAHTLELIEQVKSNRLAYTEVPVNVTYTEYSLGKGQGLSGIFRIFIDWVFRI
jgi:polyprenyl-phospho-N-acetylgalactosaminyl synthase